MWSIYKTGFGHLMDETETSYCEEARLRLMGNSLIKRSVSVTWTLYFVMRVILISVLMEETEKRKTKVILMKRTPVQQN